MIQKESYPVARILPLLGYERIELDGDVVRGDSLRLLNFKVHGIVCVTCGIEGVFFRKEKHHVRDVSFHLNLYAIGSDGTEVLMTKDHIIPVRLKGMVKGIETLENMQPMCAPCNVLKGGKHTIDLSNPSTCGQI